MTRRQLAVPMVAALLGGAVTACRHAGGLERQRHRRRQQGLLAIDTGGERFTATELYEPRGAVGGVDQRPSVQPEAAFRPTRAASWACRPGRASCSTRTVASSPTRTS